MAKKRMSNKKFLSLTLGFAAGLGCILVATNVAAGMYGGVLDTYLPQGEMSTTQVPGSENWDKNYYQNDFNKDAKKTDENAKATTLDIASEGITLLKNDGILPLTTSKTKGTDKKVTLLGRRGAKPINGGTGSGAGDDKQCISIIDALKGAGYDVNPTVTEMYLNNLANVPTNSGGMDQPTNTTSYIGEFPQKYFTSDIVNSYKNYHDAAIVVLGREGGEGLDFETDMKGSIDRADYGNSSKVEETKNYKDGQHQLELSKEERDLINHAKANFSKVIVLLNTANVMEIRELRDDPKINSIVWMGYPGSRGTVALANILNGTTNPSGHTVDIWPSDLTNDPTFPNTNVSKFSNVNSSNALGDSYTIEYEEGIYVGYRYYETKFADGGKFKVEDNLNATYEEAVAYPFGYGISYTTFAQELLSTEVVDDKLVSKVKVTNTGDVPGKDVVQLYYTAPYIKGGIEKSAVNLGGFTKTKLLKAGESETYEISWNVDQMASYDYITNKCYVLDAGDYEISARKNSHEVYGETKKIKLEQKIYNKDNPRPSEIEAQTGEGVNYSEEFLKEYKVNSATNKFDKVSEHFSKYNESKEGAINFTREDFDKSFPTALKASELVATPEEIKAFGDYAPDYIDGKDVAPTTNASKGIQAVELRGANYDDPRWEDLLNQLSPKDMTDVIYAGNQGTVAKTKIGLPSTKATDGPAGLKQYGGLGFGASGNFNCCGAIVAATWNVELAERYGKAVGNEAVLEGVSGWYAPGNDLHRSAFGGRNFEYYSEDPVLAGSMNAGTIIGCASKGLVCYTKHFAVNEMERHRVDNGPAVYVNEQALRELYLKAFEIGTIKPKVEIKYLDNQGNSLKKTIRATTGMMSSFTRLGTTWCGGNEELLNGVLRGEWGFMGTVITDYNGSKFMNVEQGVSRGNDLMLANAQTLPSKFKDYKNASSIIVMRKALKNIIYSIINSTAVNGMSSATVISYGLAPWRLGLIITDALVGTICLGLITWAIIRTIRLKKQSQIEISND